MNPEIRTLSVGALTRVEGEGALHIRLKAGQVDTVELNIYEPPRFFEAFLRGRAHSEAPDITARVCGICPVAYQISACNAIEDACGVVIEPEVLALRRLLYCGEWIHSHAMHIFLLHAPDFLGYPDAISLAKDYPEFIERGFRLKKAGNKVMELIGGRAIHPINVRLGGFYSVPSESDFTPLIALLRIALDDAIATVQQVCQFDFPAVEFDHEYLALTDPEGYPINHGAIARSSGLAFDVADFTAHVAETQVAHSTALHAALDGNRYLTGPTARFALNSARLSPIAQELSQSIGLHQAFHNPFYSIVIRSIEVVYAVEEALRLIESYRRPERPAVPVPAKAGVGHGVSEAPRGLLYHQYEIGDDGLIQLATIIPPTSQNQAAIEHELAAVVGSNLALDDTALTTLSERIIRNHDPCISCAAHFLSLTVHR
jgi:coenzyme F420-reducing hydrogenase alpha subunit